MALNDTIDKLMRRQAARRGIPPAEPDAGVDRANDVDAVMDEVRVTLVPFIAAESASVSSDLIDVSEEMIGTYSAQRLTIDVAGVKIIVEAVARYTFGGSGRIDMYRENRPSEDDRRLILRPTSVRAGGRLGSSRRERSSGSRTSSSVAASREASVATCRSIGPASRAPWTSC